MKNLFYFVLGLCLVILTSATTVSVMTIKPAIPKQVIVKALYKRDFTDFTYKYVKLGFKIHTVTSINEYDDLVVVMEKY